MKTPVRSAAALTAVLALAACAPEEQAEFDDDPAESPDTAGEAHQADDPEDTGSPEPEEPETQSPEPAAEAREEAITAQAEFVPVSGELVSVEVEAGPIIRQGDLAAVQLSFDYLEGEQELNTLDILGGLVHPLRDNYVGGQVRLIDTQEMTVAEVARSEQGEGSIAAEAASQNDLHHVAAEPGETLEWVGFFEAPQADSASVLLPYFGLLADLPVVEGDLEDARLAEDPVELEDLEAPSFDLITWRESPHYVIDVDPEETTVSLPSDVLFDVDSSDLSPDAEEALQSAAQEMADTEGGELRIVGHTDDVLDEEYNQALSEDRAEAVHQRLRDLADLDAFDEVSVTGESFREPIADNSTDDGRALNRRVELHFTTVTEGAQHEITGELPEPEGPVAAADEELTITNQQESFEDIQDDVVLSIESLERHDGLIIAGIRAEAVNDDTDIHWPFQLGTGSLHRAFEVGGVDLPYLALGEEWIHPLRYFHTDIEIDEEEPEDDDFAGSDYRLLTSTQFSSITTYDAGESAVAYLIYPDPGYDELTLESPGEREDIPWLLEVVGLNPWRFEDVPVTEASSTGADSADSDAGIED